MKRIIISLLLILSLGCATKVEKVEDIIIQGDIMVYGTGEINYLGLMNPYGVIYEIRGDLVPYITANYQNEIIKLKGQIIESDIKYRRVFKAKQIIK